jgi:hypothetical protein
MNGIAGDMNSYRFTVLPKNVDLPRIYKYRRLLDGRYFKVVCGGGGFLLVRTFSESWAFTSNGIHYKTVTAPVGFNPATAASTGTWRLQVIDTFPGDTGKLAAATLTLHGRRIVSAVPQPKNKS